VSSAQLGLVVGWKVGEFFVQIVPNFLVSAMLVKGTDTIIW
jgi:hypothetical protein